MLGVMQANEVIKYITRTGELLAGKILILDAQNLQSRIIKLAHATRTHVKQLPETPVVARLEGDHKLLLSDMELSMAKRILSF